MHTISGLAARGVHYGEAICEFRANDIDLSEFQSYGICIVFRLAFSCVRNLSLQLYIADAKDGRLPDELVQLGLE